MSRRCVCQCDSKSGRRPCMFGSWMASAIEYKNTGKLTATQRRGQCHMVAAPTDQAWRVGPMHMSCRPLSFFQETREQRSLGRGEPEKNGVSPPFQCPHICKNCKKEQERSATSSAQQCTARSADRDPPAAPLSLGTRSWLRRPGCRHRLCPRQRCPLHCRCRQALCV